MGKFQSTKLFDNYSVAIRQWKAQHSHCQLLHGYALKFRVWFESNTPDDDNMGLDDMNWIVDYGGFKEKPVGNGLKAWMDHMFDHTVIVAKDDPNLSTFQTMEIMGIIQLRIVEATGAEKFAEFIYNKLNEFVQIETQGRVRIAQVEFMEHGKNTAIYKQ